MNNDPLQLFSIYLGLLNLVENREQSEHNDVASLNDKQARYLLEEIGRKFDEQNELLREILSEVKHERDSGIRRPDQV